MSGESERENQKHLQGVAGGCELSLAKNAFKNGKRAHSLSLKILSLLAKENGRKRLFTWLISQNSPES